MWVALRCSPSCCCCSKSILFELIMSRQIKDLLERDFALSRPKLVLQAQPPPCASVPFTRAGFRVTKFLIIVFMLLCHGIKSTKISCLNDFRPVALTTVVMKSFEHIVLFYVKSTTTPLMDTYQFAYQVNRSVGVLGVDCSSQARSAPKSQTSGTLML